ncbi:MAG: helix-turn-helix transcriptional regulator [Actinomycetia bacterium]|nr:helix-turn-helix transcriptional regulator [Actinomycetes bacterium]MCP4227919.1 helix-turn-helix transcriptional regulator [Actinomycetes bacterium]MCP5030767.1 helix-turn-helix transcriptional regulator [Actinomycetes bacterium]
MSTDSMANEATDEFCCPPLTGCVLDEDQATQLATRLKALADPVRIRLVSLLACSDVGELCACDLPEIVGRSQPTVSHHLKILAAAGIVEREQRGKWAWFRLNPRTMTQLTTALGTEDDQVVASGQRN